MKIFMMAMMTPVHVAGGMEYHTQALCEGLARRGHDVTVITGRHPKGLDCEEVNGVKTHYVGKKKAGSLYPVEYWEESAGKFEELCGNGCDIIHSQSFASWGVVRKGLHKKNKTPVVATIHGTFVDEVESALNQGVSLKNFGSLLFHPLAHLTASLWNARACSRIIVINKNLAELVPRIFFVGKDKIDLVYNGVDTSRFKPKPPSGEMVEKYGLEGKKAIMTTGALHRQKGVQYLIEALGMLDGKFVLLVAGEGPYRKELEKLVMKQGLKDRVVFCGRLPNELLNDYYSVATAIVFPTVRVEGLPLVIPEAMASGKPVIASEIGGIKDVIKDGVDGFLTTPASPKDIAEKVRLVSEDRTLSEKICKAGARKALEKFGLERMIDQTVQAYNKAAGI